MMTLRTYLSFSGMRMHLCHSKISFLADPGQKSKAPQEQFDQRAEEYVASREMPLRKAIDLLVDARITRDEDSYVAFWDGEMMASPSREVTRGWLLGRVTEQAFREGGGE